MITISHPVLIFITGTLIPLITAVITRYGLSGWIKGLITLFLNTVVAFLTTVTSDGIAVFSTTTLYTAIFGFILSVIQYQAIWRSTRLTSSKPDSLLLPNVGIGKAA